MVRMTFVNDQFFSSILGKRP